jgi:hypothetical protein
VKRLWLKVGIIALLLSLILDMVYRHQMHASFWWHVTPAFDLLYGWLGCAGLILGAQWLGRTWLQRRATYYQEDAS